MSRRLGPRAGEAFSLRMAFDQHSLSGTDLPVFSQVLKLLLVAWDRRLIFAIRTSSTTGESDTVME